MRATLNRILSNADLSRVALKAFTDWPALEHVAVQFLQFVTPWLVVDNESLAETTLREALKAYENLALGYEIGHRRFIERLAESANILSCLRVSVKNSREQWAVWSYDDVGWHDNQLRRHSLGLHGFLGQLQSIQNCIFCGSA